MAREKTFEEYSKNRRAPGRDRRKSRGRDSERRNFGGRDSRRDRGPKRFGKNRRDLEMTKVTCDECGKDCEVPFKPTSDKPIYCSDCFEKHDPKNKGNSSKDLEIINQKLDKIMKALKIK